VTNPSQWLTSSSWVPGSRGCLRPRIWCGRARRRCSRRAAIASGDARRRRRSRHTGRFGGTFVGPTQDAVIALAQELGCETVRTYSRGKNLIRWPARGSVVWQHDSAAVNHSSCFDVPGSSGDSGPGERRVPVAEPWPSPIAEILDARPLTRVSLRARQRVDSGSDGHHGAGDVGLRARCCVDAAADPLREGRRWARRSARYRRRAQQRPAFQAATQQIALRNGRSLARRSY